MDLSNPNKIPFEEMSTVQKWALSGAALDARQGGVEVESASKLHPEWAYDHGACLMGNFIDDRAYRVKPEPKRVTTAHEMALAAWEHSTSKPILSHENSGEGWEQGVFTVDLVDGKPVRAVWEAS